MRVSTILSLCVAACLAASANASLIITGVVDGPRSGGLPKGIEFYAVTDIPDLSIYNVETPNNGAAPTGSEYALSGSILAGQYLWLASESTQFTNYFGFAPTLTSGVANINGDDNVILYKSGVPYDYFGAVGVDGTGQPWDYEDGYAYRIDKTGPDSAGFVLANWTFSGANYLDSQGTAGANGTDGKTVPFGTYEIPEPTTIGLMLVSLGGLFVRRK